MKPRSWWIVIPDDEDAALSVVNEPLPPYDFQSQIKVIEAPDISQIKAELVDECAMCAEGVNYDELNRVILTVLQRHLGME